MSDAEILLNAFLGTDFAQSLVAELGESTVAEVWMNGYMEAQAIHIRANAKLIEQQQKLILEKKGNA